MGIGQRKSLPEKYRPLFLSIIMILCFSVSMGQTYNPGSHIIANDAIGYSQATPGDGRSMLWDVSFFRWRDYASTTEVLTTLPVLTNRFGHYPIYVHQGGSLSGGIWTGGITVVYFFKNGTADSNLVRWYTDSSTTACPGCLLGPNNLSDVANATTSRANLGLGTISTLSATASGGDLSGSWPSPTVSRFNGQLPSFYLNYNNLTNTPAIPPQLNPTGNGLVSITGTYPNLTFSGRTPGIEETIIANNALSADRSINTGVWNLRLSGTAAFGLPRGTTAQRPSSPQVADERYNTDSLKREVWNGSTWVTDGTGGGGGGGINALTGDVSASGTGSVVATLATVNPNPFVPNTFLKFGVNGKGLVTSATAVVSGDIISALGYTPYNATNPSGYISLSSLSANLPILYNSSTGNISLSTPNTVNKYLNGYGNFVTLNTDSITEGATNLFFTNARARSAISLTTTGTSGAATYSSSTGVLNIPQYNSGTVTSVGLTTPSFLTTTGSPITGSGTFTVTLANQAANTAFGNFTGSSAAPTFGKVPLAAQATNTANYIQGWDGSGNPTALAPDTLFVKNRVSGTGVQVGNISSDTLYLNNLVPGANVTLTKNADSSITISATSGSLPSIPNLTYLGNLSGVTATPSTALNYSVYNVLDYGLVNDSSTDNITAWRSLYSALPTGATVYFPGGKGYIFSDSILIDKNITIIGAGKASYTFGPIIDTLSKGATNLYFTSSTKNGICVHKSSTGKNTSVIMHALTIQNTATTPTAGNGIIFDDNVTQEHVYDVTIANFFNGFNIKSASFVHLDRSNILNPKQYGIINDNKINVDYGGNIFSFNNIVSGLATSSTAIGMIILGGGGIIVSNNFFNAQKTFGGTTEFLYDIKSTFATGVTSDVKLHHNFYENFQTGAIFMDNVNSSKILLLSVDGEEVGPYNSTAANAIYVHDFSQVTMSNIQCIATPSLSYAAIRIDSCDHVSLSQINQVGYVTTDSLIGCTQVYPHFTDLSLYVPTTSTGSDILVSNSQATGYAGLQLYPVKNNVASNFALMPHGTASGTQSEIDLLNADKASGNFGYLAIGQNTTAYIQSLAAGSATAPPINFTVGSHSNMFTLDQSGNAQFSGNITSVGTISTTGAVTTGGAITTKGGAIQYWKDATPTAAFNTGLAKPGNALGNNYVFSAYNGSSWTDVGTWFSNGDLAIGTGPTDNAAFLQTAASTTTKASFFLNGAASDVTSPTNGMLWYNSTAHTLNFRDNGITTNLLVAATNIYNSDGTLTGNRTVTGGNNNLSFTGINQLNFTSSINHINIGASGDTTGVGGFFYFVDHSTTDANYTWGSGDVTTQLSIITADRTLTLPTASQGRTLTIMNQNTFASGFKWNVTGNLKDGAGNTLTTLPNGVNYFLQGDAASGNWVAIGASNDGTFVTESSAATLTLSGATDYVFNGTTTTWTLPLLNAGQNKRYHIKNAGSGNITLQRAGSDNIYDAASVTSITIAAGATRTIVGGPSFWYAY